jgi:hypothetical protein
MEFLVGFIVGVVVTLGGLIFLAKTQKQKIEDFLESHYVESVDPTKKDVE